MIIRDECKMIIPQTQEGIKFADETCNWMFRTNIPFKRSESTVNITIKYSIMREVKNERT